MLKTAAYTRRAIDRYDAKHDKLSILAEKGTKDRIKLINKITGMSISEYVMMAVNKQLAEDMEKHSDEIELLIKLEKQER